MDMNAFAINKFSSGAKIFKVYRENGYNHTKNEY